MRLDPKLSLGAFVVGVVVGAASHLEETVAEFIRSANVPAWLPYADAPVMKVFLYVDGAQFLFILIATVLPLGLGYVTAGRLQLHESWKHVLLAISIGASLGVPVGQLSVLYLEHAFSLGDVNWAILYLEAGQEILQTVTAAFTGASVAEIRQTAKNRTTADPEGS